MNVHRRAISWCRIAAASAMFIFGISGCSDLTVPGEVLLSTDDLLILPFQAGTPQPETASFWIYNSQQTVHVIVHPDQFNNPYLELTFPVGSLSSFNGTVLLDTDSVLVTVIPWSGRYGFTLSPNDLEFRLDATPTAKIRFAVYADASIADQSAKYDSPAEYAAALDIWREVTVATWQVAENSAPTSADAVTASIETSGEYVLAAPR